MGESTLEVNLFDQVADDGRALRRGYLELVIDEQHAEGASPKNGDGSINLTLTLYALDESNKQKTFFMFPTRVRDEDLDTTKGAKLLAMFMDKLTNTYGVSTLTTPEALNEFQLSHFRTEVEYATASWVD
jgi:hypothetical protein